MNTDFAKELAEGSGKLFKGVGLLLSIITLSAVGVIGVATPLANSWIESTAMKEELDKMKGKLEYAQESANSVMTQIGRLQERVDELELRNEKLNNENQNLIIENQNLRIENKELVDIITRLKLKDGNPNSFSK